MPSFSLILFHTAEMIMYRPLLTNWFSKKYRKNYSVKVGPTDPNQLYHI